MPAPTDDTPQSPAADRPLPRHWHLLPCIAAFVLTIPALGSGMFVDDLWHKAVLTNHEAAGQFIGASTGMFSFTDGDPARTRALMDLGVMPWWTLDTVKLNFWRPVTAMTHALDYRFWPDRAWIMHLHSLLWYAAGVWVVFLLYRRTLGAGWLALVAAMLFAVDDAHAMPAGWLANRNALIALVFGAAAILLHVQWRQRGHFAALAGALVSLTAALLANEGGIAATAYLFAYAAALDTGSWKRRIASLLPYAAAAIVWRAVYQWQGYGAWGSASYVDPVTSPADFALVFIGRAPVLLLAQFGLPPSDVFTFLPWRIKAIWWTGAMVFLIGVILAAIPLIRRDATARFFALGCVLSVIPFTATFTMDRLLLFPGIGAMGIIALWLRDWRAGAAWPHRRIAANAIAIAVLLVHGPIAAVLLPTRIAVWDAIGESTNATLRSAEFDAAIADKTVVVLNAPNLVYGTYLYVAKALAGEPLPNRIVSLAPNGGVPVPIVAIRPDASTLIYRPDVAYRWVLFRNRHHPFAPGDTVALPDYTVEIVHTTDAGVPVEVAFHFNKPLEDPSLAWYRFTMRDPWMRVPPVLERTTPPAIGETIVLRPQSPTGEQAPL